MRLALRPLVLVLILHVICAGNCFSDEYSQMVGDAISKIEIGRYDQASPLIAEILSRDEDDILGRMGLAAAYLHAGQLADAKREFQRVLSLDPGEWRARYALGLTALVRKDTAEAERHLAMLDDVPEARHDTLRLRAYLDFMAGKPVAVSAERTGSSSLLVEMAAVSVSRSGDRDRAIKLLSDLTALDPPGFDDVRAPTATFDAGQPIVVPGGKFAWKPIKAKDVPTVSEKVTLYADAKNLSGVHFVSLYVDDACVGVTNREPYSFDWDSTAVSNGLHHIRIEAKTEGGSEVNEKSVWVRVSNRGRSAKPSSEVALVRERLWNCIRLSGSRKLAHYQLAKLLSESGDRDGAIKHLQCTVAYDPNFLDARKLLNELRGWRPGYVEVRKASPGEKMVALTFDDGPNERSAEMLEVLAKLNVPATFFLVGFRAQLQPELVRALVSAGHEVENHSYTHANLTTLPADQVEAELSKCAAAVYEITGKSPRYFRPPGGHANEAVKQAAGRQGFTAIFWTVLCSPYEGAKYEQLAQYVIKNASDGAIVLMHNGEPATTSALPGIVGTLRARGYRFVTLSELLGAR